MINIILGTKAQLIKMAPVMKVLQERDIPYRFIHTGQHRETMEKMYDDFGIRPPDITLVEGDDVNSMGKIVFWAMKVLCKGIFFNKSLFHRDGSRKNNIVVVHGDTFSTLLGALLGRLSGMAVGHVEAGLRSFNYFHPFPEEITRVLVFRLSSILYCPGNWAAENVAHLKKTVVNTKGNTLLDTIALSRRRIESAMTVEEAPYGIVSLHRYENIFKRDQLRKIVVLIEKIAENNRLLFILHSPTKKQLEKYGFLMELKKKENIVCTDRFSHSDFLKILLAAQFVITDGGSLQEESSYLGIPCLLFREATERMEGIGKNVVLSQFDEEKIFSFVQDYSRYDMRNQAAGAHSPTEIIVDHLQQFL